MKINTHKIKDWLRVNGRDILKILSFIMAGIVLILLISLLNSMHKAQEAQGVHSENQGKIIRELAAQARTRNANVEKLIRDNAEQTLILCTIILNEQSTLSPENLASVENICSEQIQQIQDEINQPVALTGGTSAERAGNQGRPEGSSSNNNSTTTNPQPNTSQPTPPPAPPTTQPPEPTPPTSVIPFKEGCTVTLLGVCI